MKEQLQHLAVTMPQEIPGLNIGLERPYMAGLALGVCALSAYAIKNFRQTHYDNLNNSLLPDPDMRTEQLKNAKEIFRDKASWYVAGTSVAVFGLASYSNPYLVSMTPVIDNISVVIDSSNQYTKTPYGDGVRLSEVYNASVGLSDKFDGVEVDITLAGNPVLEIGNTKDLSKEELLQKAENYIDNIRVESNSVDLAPAITKDVDLTLIFSSEVSSDNTKLIDAIRVLENAGNQVQVLSVGQDGEKYNNRFREESTIHDLSAKDILDDVEFVENITSDQLDEVLEKTITEKATERIEEPIGIFDKLTGISVAGLLLVLMNDLRKDLAFRLRRK